MAKNKKRKVCIIGHFGGKKTFFDGQTVKTKLLYDELNARSNWKIKKVDTYYKKRRPLKLFFETVFALLSCKDVFVLLSVGGLKLYIPLLNFFIKIRKNNVYHDVIGGRFHLFLKDHPKDIKKVNRFKVNWVQTQALKDELNALGVNNAEILPNFKPLVPAEIKNNVDFKKPYPFCIFSRVMREKGITDAIEAIKAVNNNHGEVVATLDIYGPVNADYKEEFEKLLEENKECVSYKGAVDFHIAVETLQNYYVSLFPTRWAGEGFAATILDSFFAGLPVIATDWHCNKEIITPMKNGMLYPCDKCKTMEECLEFAIDNKDLFIAMKPNTVEVAKDYTPEKYINGIIKLVEGNDGKNK